MLVIVLLRPKRCRGQEHTFRDRHRRTGPHPLFFFCKNFLIDAHPHASTTSTHPNASFDPPNAHVHLDLRRIKFELIHSLGCHSGCTWTNSRLIHLGRVFSPMPWRLRLTRWFFNPRSSTLHPPPSTLHPPPSTLHPPPCNSEPGNFTRTLNHHPLPWTSEITPEP